jgi:hypothetical protein
MHSAIALTSSPSLLSAGKFDKQMKLMSITEDILAREGVTNPQHRKQLVAMATALLPMEFVSPILQGDNGQRDMQQILRRVTDLGVSTNESTSVHVHIDCAARGPRGGDFGADVGDQEIGEEALECLKNVCANYCLYEAAFDLMMPAARQGSKFARSNRTAVLSAHTKATGEPWANMSKKQQNRAIVRMVGGCTDFMKLFNLVNPKYLVDNDGSGKVYDRTTGKVQQIECSPGLRRYYKLNLRPFKYLHKSIDADSATQKKNEASKARRRRARRAKAAAGAGPMSSITRDKAIAAAKSRAGAVGTAAIESTGDESADHDSNALKFVPASQRHIEFRQHYGTTDEVSAVMWVQLLTRFVSKGAIR